MHNYPLTRHYQRYEYLLKRGFVKDKTVIDVGCGNLVGTYILGIEAKSVMGIDPELAPFVGVPVMLSASRWAAHKDVKFMPYKLEELPLDMEYDVGVCMEVFEHIPTLGLDNFIRLLAVHCKRLFISTPLAGFTAPTRNPLHVNEYTHKDFIGVISKHFNILESVYQTSDLRMVKEAVPNGDSIDLGHVVQMCWGERK